MPYPSLPYPSFDAPERPRPLFVTDDPDLLDDLLRLAAAAGVEPEVVDAVTAARRSWMGAPLVLLDARLAGTAAVAGLSRRPGLVLLAVSADDADVWRRAVAVGAEHVVVLPEAEQWLVGRLSDAAEPAEGSHSAAEVVCVIGGRGGAGASTLAAALSFAGLRRELPTVLLDADPLGGGIDLLLGGEDQPGLRWPDLAGASGRVAASTLRGSLPSVDTLTVLSWDRGDTLQVPVTAMRSVLGAARRGGGVVVVDLPRRADAAAEVALADACMTYLVVPAEVRAAAAAARVAASIRLMTREVQVVVRGPAPGDLEPEVVAASLGLPLAGHCRAEPGLAAALERGEPPGRRRGPLSRLADRLLDQVAGSTGVDISRSPRLDFASMDE